MLLRGPSLAFFCASNLLHLDGLKRDAPLPGHIQDHLLGELERGFEAFPEGRLVFWRTAALPVLFLFHREVQAPIRKLTTLAPPIAIVVDAGNEPGIFGEFEQVTLFHSADGI
jgi:hypothetical protein